MFRISPLALELAAVAVFTAAMALALQGYGYSETLSEYDTYSVALGLWHGAVSGQGLASPLHYYVWLAYGYVELVNLFAGPGVLTDHASITHLMNQIGFVSTLAIPVLAWLALRILYGPTSAIAATLMFTFSPIFLDIAATPHSILPALALFLLGAVFLFAGQGEGWRRLLLWTLAAICLAFSVMVRFEVAFAFPFLVLAQPRTDSLRSFLLNALARATPGIAAIAAFFAMQVLLLGAGVFRQTGSFLGQWYSLANLAKGVAAVVLAAGVITTALAVCALAMFAFGAFVARRDIGAWIARHAHLLAPAGLIGAASVFWLPDPLPARHFTMLTFGFAVLIALTLAHWPRMRSWAVIVTALGVCIANQAATLATGPIFARISPSDLQTPVGVLVPAPAEPAWTRRMILKARSARAEALASALAARTCARRLVVITQQAPTLLNAFLRRGERPEITLESAYAGAFQYRLRDGGREIDFIQNGEGAAHVDVLALVLADPTLAQASIFVDPMTQYRVDRAEPPPERLEPFSCNAHGAE